MSKTAASTALQTTIRTVAISPPGRFVDWLSEQIPRAKLFSLKQTSTVGPSQDVDSWADFKTAETLAGKIWERAIEDSEAVAGLGATAYVVFATAKDGSEGSRFGLRLPPPKSTESGHPTEPPNEAGIIASALRHLNMRESASHALFVEGLEGVFATVRMQLEEANKTRGGDRLQFETVIKGYESLMRSQAESFTIANKELSQQLKRTQEAYETIVGKHLDIIPQLEELASNRHVRDLEVIKAQASERRKDKAIDQVQTFLFPALAKKFGIPLGVFMPPATGTKPAAGETKSPAAEAKAPPGTMPPAPEGMEWQSTFLPTEVLRAVELFLGKFVLEDLEPMQASMCKENRERFDAVLASMMGWVKAQEAAAAAASTTNGAAKGAPS